MKTICQKRLPHKLNKKNKYTYSIINESTAGTVSKRWMHNIDACQVKYHKFTNRLKIFPA